MSVNSLKSSLVFYRMRILGVVALITAVLVVSIGAEGQPDEKINHYIGAEKCKTCHEAKEKGDQYHIWKKTKHSTAFDTLASDKAKEYAKKAGVENPQTDAKCMQCHETGFGEDKSKFAKSFLEHTGVQCETCHGPGEKHVAARFEAASKAPAAGGDDGGFGFAEEGAAPKAPAVTPIPAGEILIPKQDTCLKCHNDKSPSAQAAEKFDFVAMSKKIEHKDPRKTAAAPDKK